MNAMVARLEGLRVWMMVLHWVEESGAKVVFSLAPMKDEKLVYMWALLKALMLAWRMELVLV